MKCAEVFEFQSFFLKQLLCPYICEEVTKQLSNDEKTLTMTEKVSIYWVLIHTVTKKN